jgi:hypothetical protein
MVPLNACLGGAPGAGPAPAGAAGAAGAAAGAGAGVGAAGAAGFAAPGWFIISIVPLNFGAAAPLILNPHLVQVVAVSGFFVPQFGQNKSASRGRGGDPADDPTELP